MLLIWLGALLIIGGVLFMAAQPMLRGRLSKEPSRAPRDDSLEPRHAGAGFRLAANWPGLALMALGALLLAVGALS